MSIQVNLKKWGNSFGLRIPYQIADSLQIKENSSLNLILEGDRLIVEKAKTLPNLDEILDSIPDDFEYPEDLTDFVTSESVGEEMI